MHAGDFDLVKDPEDGKGYYYVGCVHFERALQAFPGYFAPENHGHVTPIEDFATITTSLADDV